MSKILSREFWIHIRFMRGRDSNALLNRQKFRKRLGSAARNKTKPVEQQQRRIAIDQALTENLNLIVTDVMGVKDQAQIANIINKLHSSDTATIRQFLKDKTPGIDPTIEVTCPECDLTYNIELPITTSFFQSAVTRP
jgi:hypothetical protein